MAKTVDVLILGAGIFGVTAALELHQRHYQVALLDPGPLPCPLAASTDISKVVRIEYGPDEAYMALMEQAREGWLRWNRELGESLYHEVGMTMLTQAPMSPGGFAYESYRLLRQRGHEVERLNSADIARRLPAWNAHRYFDGYFNTKGGYAESGRVVAALVAKARRQGVTLYEGQTVAALVEENDRVIGVRTSQDQHFHAGHVVIATGAWTPFLIPELSPVMHAVGQPVFHLKPANPDLFAPPRFFVFSADVSRTGYYGFPLHPRAGVVKIARHGTGQPLHPSKDERTVPRAQIQALRAFLADSLSALAEAPLVDAHLCPYCDTLDEHFWIARHPEKEGLTVAAGGSGHGFKFGPVLGQLIADAVEGKPNSHLQKFGWRDLGAETAGEEATRYRP